MRTFHIDGSFESWRDTARSQVALDVRPSDVAFRDPWSQGELFSIADESAAARLARDAAPHVPREFLEVARAVAHNREPTRWGLLYRVLYRLTHGEPGLLDDAIDADVHQLDALAKQVRRDAHKMKAFVRFRRVDAGDAAGDTAGAADGHYVAWHRPDHRIVPYVTPFFVDRFAVMRWTILTPDQSVSWDGEAPVFGPGVPRSQAPRSDELEALWKVYYASTFNPARLKLSRMKAEMPRKHWATLPEAELIPTLVRGAQRKVSSMITVETESAAAYVPNSKSLETHREAVQRCRGCPLYRTGTQAVFGEGRKAARLVLVGEQPGDEEDKTGHPFVGPAGRVLDRALAAAGIQRKDVYLTNAVKHFKWRPYGKRRLHQKPDGGEIERCKPWLLAELRLVAPDVIVALGATAAQSLLGRKVTIARERGHEVDNAFAKALLVSYHPSAILRAADDDARDALFALLVEDLKKAHDALAA